MLLILEMQALTYAVKIQDSYALFIYLINLYFYGDWEVDLADSSICDYLWRLILAFYLLIIMN